MLQCVRIRFLVRKRLFARCVIDVVNNYVFGSRHGQTPNSGERFVVECYRFRRRSKKREEFRQEFGAVLLVGVALFVVGALTGAGRR